MPMPPELKASQIIATKPAAAALIEDLEYLRDRLARTEASRGELRRMSNILRRLLVYRDITIIATPRMGKFTFVAPDNKPAVKASERKDFHYFMSGGVRMFGLTFRALQYEVGGPLPIIPDFDPGRTIPLSLDDFLNQPVICFNKVWINRRQIVLYIANKESGVHSDQDQTGIDIYIQKVRQFATYWRMNLPDNITPAMGVHYKPDVLLSLDDMPFQYSPNNLDPVLLELLATAHFIVRSEDVIELERILRDELGIGI